MGMVSLREHEKYVTILSDEIKVKESIVYTYHVIGFVELNDVYDQLPHLEFSGDSHGAVAMEP
jgi:hypothetical protein